MFLIFLKKKELSLQSLSVGFRRKKGICPVFGKERFAQRCPAVGRLPVMLSWKRSRDAAFYYLLTFFRNSKFFQNQSHRAEFGKSELKQVQANEGGKKKPVFAEKNWARLNA